jgi:hypothetical protein
VDGLAEALPEGVEEPRFLCQVRLPMNAKPTHGFGVVRDHTIRFFPWGARYLGSRLGILGNWLGISIFIGEISGVSGGFC